MNNSQTKPVVGATAPDFEMQFFDGYEWRTVSATSLEEMQGQVVVLNFWASWCIECTYEAADLENTWQTYADQGVVMLGVAYVDTERASRQFLTDFGITYPNAPDLGTEISDKYQITAVPETFIIDQNGEVVDLHIGPVDATRLNATIERLLAEG